MDAQDVIMIVIGTIMSLLGWSLNRNFSTANNVLTKLSATVEDIDKKMVAADVNIKNILKETDYIREHGKAIAVLEHDVTDLKTKAEYCDVKYKELERHVYSAPTVRG